MNVLDACLLQPALQLRSVCEARAGYREYVLYQCQEILHRQPIILSNYLFSFDELDPSTRLDELHQILHSILERKRPSTSKCEALMHKVETVVPLFWPGFGDRLCDKRNAWRQSGRESLMAYIGAYVGMRKG